MGFELMLLEVNWESGDGHLFKKITILLPFPIHEIIIQEHSFL